MYNERKVPVGLLHMTLVYDRGEWFAHTCSIYYCKFTYSTCKMAFSGVAL